MLADVSDSTSIDQHPNDRDLGEVVRHERIRRGMTAQEAAGRASVAYKTWLRIESGKAVRNMSWAGVDRAFGLPPGTALQNRTADALNEIFDAHRRISGPQGDDEVMRAAAKAARVLIPEISEKQALELVDTVAPALAVTDAADHEEVTKRASLVDRVADLSLDDLYRLRDMVDGAIAVQERDGSRRRQLHASQALTEAFRRLELVQNAINEARSITTEAADLADIDNIERAVKRIVTNLQAVEERHPELREVHELVDRFTQELKNLGEH